MDKWQCSLPEQGGCHEIIEKYICGTSFFSPALAAVLASAPAPVQVEQREGVGGSAPVLFYSYPNI